MTTSSSELSAILRLRASLSSKIIALRHLVAPKQIARSTFRGIDKLSRA